MATLTLYDEAETLYVHLRELHVEHSRTSPIENGFDRQNRRLWRLVGMAERRVARRSAEVVK